MTSIRRWATVIGRSARKWYGDDAPELGAALAYYSLFAVAPLLVIAAAMAGIAFSDTAVRLYLESRLAHEIGMEPAKALLAMAEIAANPRHGFWAVAIGGAILVIGAVTLFVELRYILSRIWRRPASPAPSGLLRVAAGYAVAVLMVVGTGLLLMAALALSAALAALHTLGSLNPDTALLWRLLEALISLAVTGLIFALVFRLASHFAWRHIWFGAAVTSLLYALGKILFGFYIQWSGVQSGYGAAGALVVFLLWVYYTAQIFLFGAEVVGASADASANDSSGIS